MSDAKQCTPDELLEAFATLSPEDQKAVRARLPELEGSADEGPRRDPSAMMQQMMERMSAKGSNPMEMCKSMMEQMAEGGGPMAMCEQMMGKKDENCC